MSKASNKSPPKNAVVGVKKGRMDGWDRGGVKENSAGHKERLLVFGIGCLPFIDAYFFFNSIAEGVEFAMFENHMLAFLHGIF